MPHQDSGAAPIGVANMAKSYLDAAYQLEQSDFNPIFPDPVWFLVQHGWELLFKAFLLASGIKEADLKHRPFGHDLLSLLAAAEDQGMADVFIINSEARDQLTHLGRSAKRHETRYLWLNKPIANTGSPKEIIQSGLQFYDVMLTELRTKMGPRSWYP